MRSFFQKLRLRILRQHPIAVPLFTISFLMLLTGIVYLVARQTDSLPRELGSNIVIISYDRKKQTVPSRDQTVGSLMKKLNIKLNAGDIVEPSRETNIDQDQFRINIYRALPVQIIEEGQVSYALSAAKSARSIAEQEQVTVFAEDKVNLMPATDFLRSGAIGHQVVIERSVPVNLNLYGSAISLRTHAETVGDLIKQKAIKLAKDDQVTPSLDTPLGANTQVFITRNGTKIETVEQVVPTPIQTVEDASLTRGTNAVRQKGAPGKKLVTYQINLKNGIEASRTVIQEVVTQEPVVQVVARGSAAASANLEEWLRVLRMCESGGNYQTNTGNSFYGAYQFMISTWNRIAPKVNRPDLVGVRPDLASPADQDFMIIRNTQLSSGGLATQNPGCYKKHGLAQFPPSN